ncbi:hypothetical protein KJ765_06845 [Candidatus Micrarchaeota archaeon]|nr:hypothetical protein [Candidatus Micrarchaeota archaeon]
MPPLCELGQLIIDQLRDPAKMKRLETRLKKDTVDLERFYPRIQSKKLESLSDEALIQLHRDYFEQYVTWGVTGAAVEPVYLQGEQLLKQLLKNTPKREHTISILSTGSKPSFSVRQEIDLLQIAVDEKLTKKSDFASHPALKKKLEAHAKQYFWMQNSYWRTRVLDANYFQNEMVLLLREKEARDYIRSLNGALKMQQKEKHVLMEFLKLTDSEKKLVEIIDYFAWFQDYRKEVILQATHYLDVLLNEFARRSGYSLQHVKNALPSEMPLILSKALTESELEKRSECLVLWKEFEDALRLYSRVEAAQIEEKLFPKSRPTTELVEFSGTAASPGKVQGRAVVTMNPDEANRSLKKGDILVTSMTSPDFVPAMKKAAAVVTNEGGITCHAAIVSREFGIPCVVGTRVASKILKTGDWVEVDANHSQVRKLVK